MEEDFKSELDWADERLDDLIKFTQDEKFRKLPVEDQDLIVRRGSVNALLADGSVN